MSAGVVRREVARAMSASDASKLVGSTVPHIGAIDAPEAELITEPTILTHLGEPIAAYLPLRDAAVLRRAVLTIDCSGGVQRNTAYRSRSRTFGFAPKRVVTRRESCSLTALGRDQPEVQTVLERYVDQFSDMLIEIDPNIVATDSEVIGGVLPDWRMGEAGLWTSGVVNDTAALPYHRDGFNFPTWSAMPVLRRGVRGGLLHLPEWGVALACADATVTLFPGKRWVHGVTPLERAAADGYRISIVYYALSGMRDCRTAAEETRYAQTKRTERETEMARRMAEGDMGIPGKTDPSKPLRQAFAGWRGTGMGDRDWNSEAPRQ